jgi:arylformamidase
MVSRFGVKAALLLGGLYDLAPLIHSFLQDEIHLTDEEVKRWTPMDRPFTQVVDCAILVGEQETPPSMIRRRASSAILFSKGQGQASRYLEAQTT